MTTDAQQLIAATKLSGRCPPSIIGDDRVAVLGSDGGVSFEGHVWSTLLDGGRAGFHLAPEAKVARDFEIAVKVSVFNMKAPREGIFS